MKTKLIKPSKQPSPEGEDLISELNQLLLLSVNARNVCGATHDIRHAYIRECNDPDEISDALPEGFGKPDPDCDCKEGESCDLCDEELMKICSMDETMSMLDCSSPFRGIGKLLATIKAYDYIALAEHAYAIIGNKPFKLKSNKKIDISDKQKKELAGVFEETLDSYIKTADVRINEIPQAFNFETVSDMIEASEIALRKETKDKNDLALKEAENVLERIFNRTEAMLAYLEVIKDTANNPIGIMWIDDNALLKTRKLNADGSTSIERKIQSSVERVPPADCFFTPDHTLSKFGRAVFRVKRYSYGDIKRWSDNNLTGSDKLNKNIDEFLDEYPDGGTIPCTLLFRHMNPLIDVDYDVIVTRGYFNKEHIDDLDIDIPASMKHDKYIPCEIYFSGSYVLRVRVMDVLDKRLGVYTTLFRRNGDSLFGYSVYDFTRPFATLYESTIDKIDLSVGRSLGMFVQVDKSVIIDYEKYFKRDKEGRITLDISKDNVIEFDSTEAFGAPNFRGVPISIEQIPSNLQKLVPMLNLAIEEMDRITKIPTLLVDGTNISSALRTTSNFNAAFQASSKVIKALLRESENRVLLPSIKYVFGNELAEGRMPDDLVELEPEVLLSDTLTREVNSDREMLTDFVALSQFREIIPPDKFGALLNTVAKEVFNHDEDIVPNVGVLSIRSQASEPRVV